MTKPSCKVISEQRKRFSTEKQKSHPKKRICPSAKPYSSHPRSHPRFDWLRGGGSARGAPRHTLSLKFYSDKKRARTNYGAGDEFISTPMSYERSRTCCKFKCHVNALVIVINTALQQLISKKREIRPQTHRGIRLSGCNANPKGATERGGVSGCGANPDCLLSHLGLPSHLGFFFVFVFGFFLAQLLVLC